MTPIYLTLEEADVLAVAVAKGIMREVYTDVDPTAFPTNRQEAAAVIWAHREVAGQPLCSLATMFAEL
jgi:hypothetical protein